MDYVDLKDLLSERNITVVQKDTMRVRGFDVDSYRTLAQQTGYVDYDCDFRDGTCRSQRTEDRGCCSKCAGTLGYWRKEGDTLDEDTVKKLAGFYDEKTGFIRDGCGCILPRELRSPTCLYIFCSDANMSGHDRELLYRIQYGANWG
jgi:hypothetical protein